MKAEFISKEKDDVKFTMEFDAEAFEDAQIEAYKKNKDKFDIDGFRKGKAPRKVIEQRFGESVFMEEAIDGLMQANYGSAITELDLAPIDMPRVEFSEIKKGEGFTATLTVTVEPEITLGDYTGIKIKDIEVLVTDEDVDKELENMQVKAGRFVESDEAAADGDIVNIDYEGSIDGVQFGGGTAKEQNLKLGSQTFIPGFEDQLIGAKKGDEKDVNVTFPEEYHAEELKGKDAVFKVKVNEVRKEEKPELNDEFAKDTSEFDTLAELKDDIRKRMTEAAEERAEYEKKNAVLEKIYEENSFDVPAVMIEDSITDMTQEFAQNLRQQGLDLESFFNYTGQDQAAFRENLREEAEKRVKMRLIIKAIINNEGFEATDEEVETELSHMAAQYGMEVDKLKDYLGGQMEMVKGDIKSRKAVDYVFETAIIEEADVEDDDAGAAKAE